MTWQPGEPREIGGKLYVLCPTCGSIVKHKPIFGLLHFCTESDET